MKTTGHLILVMGRGIGMFRKKYGLQLTPRSVLLLLVLLSTQHLALSSTLQSATATLSGTVVDEKNAVVPETQITITNTDTGLKREATTNSDGYFTAPLLPPGNYTLASVRQGFATVEVRDIVLNVGDQRSLQIQMKVGQIGDSVTIEADALSINSSDAAVGTVVDRQFVENLPLNGRS